MRERTRIGVVASPGYDAEARLLQLALDANGTFDLVGCTTGLERSKVPNSATRTYSSPAEFVLGEKSINGGASADRVADLGIIDSGELEKVNRFVTTTAKRVCSR